MGDVNKHVFSWPFSIRISLDSSLQRLNPGAY